MSAGSVRRLVILNTMPHTFVALLLNQHQPLFRDLSRRSPVGAYGEPWIRLYAAKDYYEMAALLLDYPRVHATFTLMPSLVWQLQDYAENGATDLDYELAATPAARLTREQRGELVRRGFRVSFESQVLVSTRFTALYTKYLADEPFSEADLTDLQVWANLVWIHPHLRETRTRLFDGSMLDVRALVEQDQGFTHEDVLHVLEAHLRLVRNVLPLHRHLAERGQIELATGPFYAPILPLLWNTDTAVLDRPGARLPPTVSRPGDVRLQIEQAAAFHEQVFGARPRGLWPPAGALCEGVVELLEDLGFEWTVVAKSALQPLGDETPDFSETDLFTHPWRAPTPAGTLAVFPRESWLSNRLETVYAHAADYTRAAMEVVTSLCAAVRFGEPDAFAEEVVTLVVDGDHPWTSYRRNGVRFLRALYEILSSRRDLATTTFHEYLAGSENKLVPPHPVATLPRLGRLRCFSRRDEPGSRVGADLGMWIGEPEENEAWVRLRRVAEDLEALPDSPRRFPAAWQSLLAAEEASTFRYLGEDNDPPPGTRRERLALFKQHLQNAYRLANQPVPDSLATWEPAPDSTAD